MQAVLNLVWGHLLPALGSVPLPEDRAAQAELDRKLAGLSFSPVRGERSSPVAARVSGKTYVLEPNEPKMEAMAFDFGPDESTVTIRDGRGEQQFACGDGAWIEGTLALESDNPRPVAASGAWTAEDTYEIVLCFYETPFRPTITCRFADDRLALDMKVNVSFGPLERPQLVGRIAPES
jgi:hypothetical protein